MNTKMKVIENVLFVSKKKSVIWDENLRVCLEFGYILMRENNVFKELN
jgi:hypothetical protein